MHIQTFLQRIGSGAGPCVDGELPRSGLVQRVFYETNIVADIPENSRHIRHQYSCVYAASKRNMATPKMGKAPFHPKA